MSALLGKLVYAIFAPLGMATIVVFASGGHAYWSDTDWNPEGEEKETMDCRSAPVEVTEVSGGKLDSLKWCSPKSLLREDVP